MHLETVQIDAFKLLEGFFVGETATTVQNFVGLRSVNLKPGDSSP